MLKLRDKYIFDHSDYKFIDDMIVQNKISNKFILKLIFRL
jgi:hypothetical protein